jgi:hypothetical protein
VLLVVCSVAAADAGEVRRDIPATELASYCVHALTAAASSDEVAAQERLVEVCLQGLLPPQSSDL